MSCNEEVPPGFAPPCPSSLLADPEWDAVFRTLIDLSLTAAIEAEDRPASHFLGLTRQSAFVSLMHQLDDHLLKVARHQDLQDVSVYYPGRGVWEAYIEAWAMFGVIKERQKTHPKKLQLPLTILKRIKALLAQSGPPAPRREHEQPTAAPTSGTVTPESTSAGTPRKEPTKNAIAAYRAVKILGQKQENVAPQFGVSQGTVSRWIDRVSEWIAAGNILPDLDAPKRKPVAMDPQKLEQGPNPRRAHNRRICATQVVSSASHARDVRSHF